MGVTEFVIVQLQAEFVGDGDITQKTLPGTRMGLVDKVVDRNSAEVHHVLAFREDGTNKRGLRCDLDFGFRSFGHAALSKMIPGSSSCEGGMILSEAGRLESLDRKSVGSGQRV